MRVIHKIYETEGNCSIRIGDVYNKALALHLHNYYAKSLYDVHRM